MEKHPIDRLFEEKLKDFADMPNTNLWEHIEKQIPHQKKQEKGFFRRFWWVLLLLLPMGGSVWYVQYTNHETNVQKVEKNTNQMPQTAQIVENSQSADKITETVSEENTTENAIQQPVSEKNEKNEKNIKTDATPTKQNASTNQKADEKEKTTQELTEKIEEKNKENTVPTKETTNKNIDTIKNLQPKKGVKVIIKLSEPEEPKEGKARDFASTKAGKFWKKAKKIKNGEFEIPKFQISRNSN